MQRLSVFHRGALGDSVLTWPLMRAAMKRGFAVTFVSDDSKARLAQLALNVHGLNAEQRRFNSLWLPDAPIESDARVDRVVSFAGTSAADLVWRRNASRAFPNALIDIVHDQLDRNVALKLADGTSGIETRVAFDSATVVCHVGTGGGGKCWDLSRWSKTVRTLRNDGLEVRVIAGEVEAERFSHAQRGLFLEMNGTYLTNIDQLYVTLRDARCVIAADSGPGHVAAQLGATVLSLFGPTDPKRWAPIGPDVHVLAPSSPSNMTWLEPERVIAEFNRVIVLK